jgi:hypothetical protein
MPKKVMKSGLAAKLGTAAQQAFEDHKNDDTDYGAGSDLPAGIEGGIAQLVECKFDTYKKGENEGEYFFYAAGVVVSPSDVNGVRVAGLRTQIMEPMCATPTRKRSTVDEHVAWAMNELRKLGIDTKELDLDGMESAAEALKEAQPHFRFRTWKGEKQTSGPYANREPRVQHEWRGVTEYVPEEGDAGVVDDTPDEPAPSKGKPAAGKGKPAPKAATDGDDLDALAEAADGGDTEAQTRLTELAGEAGVSDDDRDSAADWAGVVALIQSAGDGGGDDGKETAADDWQPAKGEVYGYKPPKAKKPVDVEIMAVDEKKQTVNAKNLDDGKTLYRGVAWSELSGE